MPDTKIHSNQIGLGDGLEGVGTGTTTDIKQYAGVEEAKTPVETGADGAFVDVTKLDLLDDTGAFIVDKDAIIDAVKCLAGIVSLIIDQEIPCMIDAIYEGLVVHLGYDPITPPVTLVKLHTALEDHLGYDPCPGDVTVKCVYNALVAHIGTELINISLGGASYVSPPPTTPSDTGSVGQWSFGSGYMYQCVATDTWVRWAVATTW